MATLDHLIGQILDEKYLIDRQLGQGGMGVVFLATHIGTERPVAIKVIFPHFMDNAEFVERFKREARATGRLRHPNVINVTDFGFTRVGGDQIAYLVMEYLDGTTLAQLREQRPQLPLDFTINIIEQVCLAVDKAHSLGIIHRDLKPDNIWLEPDGRGSYNVKVLDFGVAKLHESPAPIPVVAATTGSHSIATEVERVNSTELTNAGAIVGTPRYMSPEQCLGERVDERSDIYSIGIIIYEMLAGSTPFTGDISTLMAQHIAAPPPSLRQQRPDLPKQIEALIMATLAKDAQERPGSAATLAVMLRVHTEGAGALLRKALAIYTEHLADFMRVSLVAHLPFIIPSLLIFYFVITTSVAAGPIKLALWPLWLVCSLLANSVSAAGCALVVEHLRAAPLRQIPIAEILKAVAARVRALAATDITSYYKIGTQSLRLGVRVWIDHTLSAPVIMIEGKQGQAALMRSRLLVSRLRALAALIQARNLLVALIPLAAFPLTFILSQRLFDYSNPVGMTRGLIIVLMLALPPLLIIFVHPPVAIAMALLYFRACQAGGEPVQERAAECPAGIPKQSLLTRAASVPYTLTAALLVLMLVIVVVIMNSV